MRRSLVLYLLAAASVSSGCSPFGQRIHFTNRLAAPIQLSVAGRPRQTVAPGETVSGRIPGGRTVVAEWEMVRPLSADNKPMGEEVRGSVVLGGAGGPTSGTADPGRGETAVFAPLISNGSSDVLRVTVNAGLQGAVDCGCAVRPGATRVFVGYYRLYGNSTVRARGKTGEATFRDLGPQVTSADGTVGLRFEDKDLKPLNRPAAGTAARPPA
jgi:hypothetical protein